MPGYPKLASTITGLSKHAMERSWLPGLTIRYEHTSSRAPEFPRGVGTGALPGPSFRTALPTQHVCAPILRSAKYRRWSETGVVAG
jgi:hypothetical protein